MEISREKGPDIAEGTSIRLRYSRQFQIGGHAHTIDAEAMLAAGASPEWRAQIIRELEQDVEQLARQVSQRGSRQTTEIQARAGTAPGKSMETPAPTRPPTPVPQPPASQSPAVLPVSESMPTTPAASGERTITLPDFLKAIQKRWDMSAKEAMDLLNVSELTGLNYREAYALLRTIKEPGSSASTGAAQTRTRPAQQTPVVEAPHQANRPAPTVSSVRPQASAPAPNTAPVPRAPVTAALSHETQSGVPTAPEPKRETLPDFAGSPKAPLPIQLGVVRDLAPRSYSFDEEEDTSDEEAYELPVDNEGNLHRQAAENKLEELKNTGGNKAASPERLNVLNTIVDGQISEEELEQLIKIAWNITNRKRLRVEQAEALINWAKEDYFVDEVKSLLVLVDDEEEE
jgi:hypothetical protein